MDHVSMEKADSTQWVILINPRLNEPVCKRPIPHWVTCDSKSWMDSIGSWTSLWTARVTDLDSDLDSDYNLFKLIWYWKAFYTGQECIPVGCVPPAHWPYLIVCHAHPPPSRMPPLQPCTPPQPHTPPQPCMPPCNHAHPHNHTHPHNHACPPQPCMPPANSYAPPRNHTCLPLSTDRHL